MLGGGGGWAGVIAKVEAGGNVMVRSFWREASLFLSEYFESVMESLRLSK